MQSSPIVYIYKTLHMVFCGNLCVEKRKQLYQWHYSKLVFRCFLPYLNPATVCVPYKLLLLLHWNLTNIFLVVNILRQYWIWLIHANCVSTTKDSILTEKLSVKRYEIFLKVPYTFCWLLYLFTLYAFSTCISFSE